MQLYCHLYKYSAKIILYVKDINHQWVKSVSNYIADNPLMFLALRLYLPSVLPFCKRLYIVTILLCLFLLQKKVQNAHTDKSLRLK